MVMFLHFGGRQRGPLFVEENIKREKKKKMMKKNRRDRCVDEKKKMKKKRKKRKIGFGLGYMIGGIHARSYSFKR